MENDLELGKYYLILNFILVSEFFSCLTVLIWFDSVYIVQS